RPPGPVEDRRRASGVDGVDQRALPGGDDRAHDAGVEPVQVAEEVHGVPAEAADDVEFALGDQHLDVPSLDVEPHARRQPGGRPGGTHRRVVTESGDDLLAVGPDLFGELRRPPVSFEIGSGEHAVLQGDAQLPPSEPEVGGELVSSVVAASCLHWHCRAFLLTLTRTRLLGGTSGGRRNGNLWITRWGTWTYRAFRANRTRGWNMM